MVMTNSIPGVLACPACGETGPHNFRLETRASFKCPDEKHKQVLNEVGKILVWACVSCSAVLKEA